MDNQDSLRKKLNHVIASGLIAKAISSKTGIAVYVSPHISALCMLKSATEYKQQ